MNDLDLMLLADGEGDLASADLLGAPDERDAQEKIEGIRKLGSLVRGHLELSADEAEVRLAGLWDLVERRLDADAKAERPAVSAAADHPGLWARITSWVGRYRSQVLTGLVTAGAAAALTMVLRPGPHLVTRTVEATPHPVIDVRDGSGSPTMTMARATPTEVESLEVNGGSGTVFTIRDDDGSDGGGETTVIWVTPDDVVEGL